MDGTWIDDAAQNPLLAMLPIDVAVMMRRVEDAAPYQGGTGGRRLAATTGGSPSSATAKAAKWAEERLPITPPAPGWTCEKLVDELVAAWDDFNKR